MNIKLLNKILTTIILISFPFYIGKLALFNSNDYVIFMDVGQGNATLLCTASKDCGLIDTGKQHYIIEQIRKYTDHSLEFLVLTHPDADHIQETSTIIDSIGVKKVYLGISNKSKNVKETILSKKIPLFELREDNDFYFGNYYFDILWPYTTIPLNWLESNDSSTSILIKNKDNTFYIAGDLGSKIEEKLAEERKLKDISVAQLSHHGSKYSSSKEFLNLIRPKLSIISVGKNSYGHPSKEVLNSLNDFNLNYLRTDELGDVKIEILKDRLEVTAQKSKNSYIILN